MTNYISVLKSLNSNLPPLEKRKSLELADFLVSSAAKRKKQIKDTTILIGYGGGKDSSWALAFLRYAQVQIFKKLGCTFKLRIITMVHLGTARSTLNNINTVYDRLAINDDPLVESNLYSYGHVEKFSKNFTIPEKQKNLLRRDILLAGHRSFGDARSTFCFSCNFHMISSSASELLNNLDYIVTGDSSHELKTYYHWIQSILQKMKLTGLDQKVSFAENTNRVLAIGKSFYTDLYRSVKEAKKRMAKQIKHVQTPPKFLPIFDFTNYGCEHHWKFLNEYLGFRFTEEAFNFTESDCRHPLLMAHLRGITAEKQGRKYKDGISDYLKLARYLMGKKEFPKNLIKEALDRYGSEQKIELMKLRAEEFGQSIGINEHNFRAMVYSPIVNKANNLSLYLEGTAQSYSGELEGFNELLNGNSTKPKLLKEFIERRTGLNLSDLKILYKSDSQKACAGFDILQHGDPHKKKIRYRDADGRTKSEIITGR